MSYRVLNGEGDNDAKERADEEPFQVLVVDCLMTKSPKDKLDVDSKVLRASGDATKDEFRC